MTTKTSHHISFLLDSAHTNVVLISGVCLRFIEDDSSRVLAGIGLVYIAGMSIKSIKERNQNEMANTDGESVDSPVASVRRKTEQVQGSV